MKPINPRADITAQVIMYEENHPSFSPLDNPRSNVIRNIDKKANPQKSNCLG